MQTLKRHRKETNATKQPNKPKTKTIIGFIEWHLLPLKENNSTNQYLKRYFVDASVDFLKFYYCNIVELSVRAKRNLIFMIH